MAERKDVWIRIATFVAVTYGFSAIFMHMAISSGEITVVSALGGMWSPLVGVFVTRLIFPDGRRRGSLSGLGWGWGRTGYQLLSLAVPVLYVLVAHVALVLAGIGRLADATPGEFLFFVLTGVFRALTLGAIFAFGEEVGWQGFLVPQLFKVTTFTKTALVRGVIWSLWHFPLLAGGVYGSTETPIWYRLISFTVTMTAVSFAFAWIRLRSGSLWTGVWMHASHNRFIQGIFPGLVVYGGGSAWFVDEMGVFTALAAIAVAFLFWRKRGSLRAGRASLPIRAATLCLVCLIVVACGGCAREQSPPARHVVFISIDTARGDHFGFSGNLHVSTPRLDALARESIVYTDYMTVVPTTLSSHVSLLTGKYPHHHGTARNGFVVNRKNEMLPEVLRDAGFSTVGFAGSFTLDERFGFTQGFDHYDQEFTIIYGESGVDQTQRRAEDVTDAAIQYLDEHGVPERLFLFVHYFDPHRPYAPPPPFETMYGPVDRENLPPIDDIKRDVGLPPDLLADYVRRHHMLYAAEISYADHHIGRLLDDLKSRGILDNAIVVVTADHGESMWEHNEGFDHGITVYQSTMHAICVVRLPEGGERAARIGAPVASIDVMPTVLEYLGLRNPSGIDGVPMPLSESDSHDPGRLRFGEATKTASTVETDPLWINNTKARCVRSGRHKLVWVPHADVHELYDVVADPAERRNLLMNPTPGMREVFRRLQAELEKWTESADPLPSYFESSQREENQELLRSLGYLD